MKIQNHHPVTRPAPTASKTAGPKAADRPRGQDDRAEKAEVRSPGHGKEASPAHRARALLAADAQLATRPFGALVSSLARGLDPTVVTDPTAPAEGELSQPIADLEEMPLAEDPVAAEGGGATGDGPATYYAEVSESREMPLTVDARA